MKLGEKGYSSTDPADVLKEVGAGSERVQSLLAEKQDLLPADLDAYCSGIRKTLLEPAWRGESDPIEKVFRLLARYRELIVETDCLYRCPSGSTALEIHEPHTPARELLAAYFEAWTEAVHECLLQADRRLPDALDRLSLAEFVLTIVQGALVLARTFRDVAYFDRAVQELRNYVEFLVYGAPSLSVPVRQALAEIGRGRQ